MNSSPRQGSTTQDIIRNLTYIHTSFIGDPEVQNVYLGKDAEVPRDPSFVDYMTNYTNFKNNFLTNISHTNLPAILVKPKASTTWSPLNQVSALYPTGATVSSTTSIITNNNNSIEGTYDIHFRSLQTQLTLTTKKNFGREPMDAMDLLNSFAAAYNFLDSVNFKNFKQEGIITVKDYTGTDLNIVSINYTAATIPAEQNKTDIINKVLNVQAISSDTTVARTDAIRRLFLGYIYMIEIYIALKMYETDTTTNNYATKNILETCIKKFIKLNESMYDTTVQGGIGKLYDGLEKRMQDYKSSKQIINNLTVDINKEKDGVRVEQNYIDSHSSFLSNNQISFYSFTIIFLVLLVSMLYIYYGPTSPILKQKIYAAAAGASLIILVIAFMVNKFVILEPFQATPQEVTLYSNIAVGVLDEYLNHTINVLRMIDTYRSYGEIATSITKEKNFYTNAHEELKLNKGALNAIQAERLRQAKILRARTYLFIQILITISFLMLLLSYQYNILYIIIAAFIILMWVYLYVFNINNLVHTDSKKFYWQQPSMQ